VFEPISDMPPGTMGFRISGKITRDEYHDLIAPVYAALERGEQLNYLIATDDDFDGVDLAALWDDVKAAGSVGVKHRSSWRRTAVVTDKDWMRRAMAAFAWVMPGEARMFEPDELDAAKASVGEGATG
jgi:stage II sporulation SpoAA-like protein